MTDTKSGAREFYFLNTGQEQFVYDYFPDHLNLPEPNLIHTIEFSAHQKALDEIERLKAELEEVNSNPVTCRDCGNSYDMMYPDCPGCGSVYGLEYSHKAENARLKALLGECRDQLEDFDYALGCAHGVIDHHQYKRVDKLATDTSEKYKILKDKLQKELEGEHERE